MKNNILVICLILAIAFIGCQKNDDYDAPNSFSDVGWYIAYPGSPWPDTLLTNKDDYITFSDLSQNATSHKWEIDNWNFYLEQPIARQDSIFDDKTIGSGETTDKTVSVWFRESGFQKVKLRNTFKEKVTFRGDKFTIEADSVGPGEWVIDKTFIVDVYDTIIPMIRIEQDGVVLNHLSETDTIFVEAGATIDLFDVTEIGRPDDWLWNIGGSRSTEKDISLVLKKLGAFKGFLEIKRAGNNIPGDYERYEIPAPFKVIPSSQPFVQNGEAIELEDEKILVPYNGEFAPFINQEEFFTVMLEGTTELQISSIGIYETDATFLEITLAEPIYAADNITVSYDGNGTLESTDTRTPEAFMDVPVTMYSFNLAADNPAWSMEDAGRTAWESTDAPLVEYSTEEVYSGNYSIKINSTGDWARASVESSPVNIPEAGNYTITWWMYIDSSTTAGSYGPWFNWKNGDADQQFWQGIRQACCGGPKPLDQWFKQTREQDLDAGDSWFTLRVNGDALMYFDEIQIAKTEKRP